MKAKIILCALFLCIAFSTKAQNYVTIPDTNFVAYLNTHYPNCMNGNQMDTTCSGIINENTVDVWSKNITNLTGIEYFNNLQILDCGSNQLTNLPVLPNSIKHLNCSGNQLTSLPTLPGSLLKLYCNHNHLTSLPTLPNSINIIYCDYNPLVNLPALPNALQLLTCTNNQLTSLPALPGSLLKLYCEDNLLTNLPALPNSLIWLLCDNNLLTSLPALPNSLSLLWCNYNPLTSLPALPDSFEELYCGFNQLTSLPALPNSLKRLFCCDNNISCFPVFPDSIIYILIANNPFTCLPNYISAMDVATLAYPLCLPGDLVNNPDGCISADGIIGYTYTDNNANCLKDSGDLGLVNIPLKLYDINNNLLAQLCSYSGGVYKFVQTSGTYTAAIDTAGMPFTVQCLHPGVDTLVTLTTTNPSVSDVNFSIVSKPGFDIGVQSVITYGDIVPGFQHALKIFAGVIGQWYNLNCSAGVSGQVVVTVEGPVTYLGVVLGARTPLISGNVYTYTIANFDSVNFTQDFGLKFTTNTSAQASDSICVNITVTPDSGDNNVSNNTYQYCYPVVNPHDPNMKEVYPINVLPGYQDYFTYTIHFQNTGTAPAHNISLVDTLSSNLDMETFRVINYSHDNTVLLNGNVLTFRFPNIMLPDSTTDEPGSKGFVQYKIKPKASLAAGTQIENTAYIYFDYNAPIATNTTVNEFNSLSIEDHTAAFQMSIYPNPVTDNATLNFTSDKAQQIQIKVHDILGQEIFFLKQSVYAGANNIQINTRNLAKGIYFLSVRDGSNGVRSVKFVK